MLAEQVLYKLDQLLCVATIPFRYLSDTFPALRSFNIETT